MTRAARLVYVTAGLLGLTVGFIGTWQGTRWTFSTATELAYLIGLPALGEFSSRQYRYADSEHAREALLMFTNFCEQLDAVHRDNIVRRDLGFAYARLSILEDEAHNVQQSQRYLAKATYWYQAGGGRIPPGEDLKLAVVKFDACLQPSELDCRSQSPPRQR